MQAQNKMLGSLRLDEKELWTGRSDLTMLMMQCTSSMSIKLAQFSSNASLGYEKIVS